MRTLVVISNENHMVTAEVIKTETPMGLGGNVFAIHCEFTTPTVHKLCIDCVDEDNYTYPFQLEADIREALDDAGFYISDDVRMMAEQALHTVALPKLLEHLNSL